MESFKHYATQTFFKHILIAIVAILLLIGFIFLSLNIYTDHGDELSVPNFSKMKMSQVRSVVDENNLRYEIIDSVFYSGQEKGTIVEQNPPVGFKVKKHRRIFLTINASSPQMVKMVIADEMSLTNAKARLETAGLKVGKLNYVTYFAKNYVLEQKYKGRKIKKGKSIPKGSKIDLTLGKGSEEENPAYVPNLHNLNRNNATTTITDAFLNVGAIIYDRSIKTYSDSINAKVWKQDPEDSQHFPVELGTSVNIWLTKDKNKLKK